MIPSNGTLNPMPPNTAPTTDSMATQPRIRPLFQLDGKVALITGASKGIGEAMARGLAEFGAHVVVSSRKQAAVDAVADALRADGLAASAIAANMGQIDDIRALVAQTVATCGGLDIVINNDAGDTDKAFAY